MFLIQIYFEISFINKHFVFYRKEHSMISGLQKATLLYIFLKTPF